VTPAVWVAGRGEASSVVGLMGEFRDWMGRDEPSDADLSASVERLLADPGSEYLLGSSSAGGRPCGVCQLRYRYGVWHSADDCWLEDLFVSERARGAGLGGALVRAAIERARKRGSRRVELDTDSDNRAAVALYEGLGFSAATAGGATRLLLRLYLGAPTEASAAKSGARGSG
jgi:ribosomal protein S18 acetylase RimI-like enzyme